METVQTANDVVNLRAFTNPDICPRCGASRSQLKSSISEKPYRVPNPWGTAFEGRLVETENHFYARAIMNSCPDCNEAVEAWQRRQEAVISRGIHIV